MTNISEPKIKIELEPANPGQFFACCGILELADRLWNGAEGWFDTREFFISPVRDKETPGNFEYTHHELFKEIAAAAIDQDDSDDVFLF